MKKILTFISKFSSSFDPWAEPDRYTCPDGAEVTGKQTNEAPVKYLMRHDPDIKQILCILTPQVKDEKQFTFSDGYVTGSVCASCEENNMRQACLSPYQYLIDHVHEEYPEVEFIPIDFSGDSFSDGPLADILHHITNGDSIYLETTGGFRDTVSQMILLSRILRFQGTELAGAVYSRYPQRAIEDVTDSYRAFELINGLSEFEHFCSTETLEQYYANSSDAFPEFEQLMTSMRELSECITMCRTGLLGERVKKFQNALKNAQGTSEPIIKALLPSFEAKFQKMKNTPEQIRWCVENNLIQQALTIYTDRLPKYLIEESKLIELPNNYYQQVRERRGRSLNRRGGVRTLADREIDEIRIFNNKELNNYALNDGFFMLGRTLTYIEPGVDCARITLNNIRSLVPSSGFRFRKPNSVMLPILKDYLYMMVLRNQFNHVNEELKPQEDRANYLKREGYEVDLDRLSLREIKEQMICAIERVTQAADS